MKMYACVSQWVLRGELVVETAGAWGALWVEWTADDGLGMCFIPVPVPVPDTAAPAPSFLASYTIDRKHTHTHTHTHTQSVNHGSTEV